MKYETYWGLRESPFQEVSGPAGFFSHPHAEAVARLQFLVENGRRLGIVRVPRRRQVVGVGDLCAGICARPRGGPCAAAPAGQGRTGFFVVAPPRIGANPRRQDNAIRALAAGQRLASSGSVRRRDAVLLVDDADAASGDVRTLILRWLKLRCRAMPDHHSSPRNHPAASAGGRSAATLRTSHSLGEMASPAEISRLPAHEAAPSRSHGHGELFSKNRR